MLTFIVIVLLLAAGVGLYCYGNKQKCEKEEEVNNVISPLKAESLLAQDFKEVIEGHRNEKMVWYTTLYELTDFLDSGNELNIKSLTNVFQSMFEIPGTKKSDVFVTKFNHDEEGTKKEIIHDFWIEDCAMDVLEARIPFEEALSKLMAANYPKPHSKQCALRIQVGPKEANAQYIFGNIDDALFVDTVTGEVSNKNPFFNN